MSGTELLWFRDYFTDHQQRVKYNDTYSDWGAVLGGIPQGSALGPLLFLIYMNNMSLQVKHGILVQFADDTCLICCGDNRSSVSQMLCEDLCQLHSWVEESRMSFNVQESNVMWFNIHSQQSFEAPPVLLDSSPLTKVDTHKYLSFVIDTNLQWTFHTL